MVAKEISLPGKLQEKLDRFQDEFWVPKERLDKIIAHFISELDRGLRDGTDPSGIPMNVAWVMEYPDGSETGDFLALDLGGTNMRVVMVHLLGNHKFTTSQHKYRLPNHIRTTRNRDDLFVFMANCLDKFVKETNPDGVPAGKIFPLGFTFSYPVTQSRIDKGILQRWTKGFDIPGVEGEDAADLMNKEIARQKLPIKIVSLINDTSGTLVASRYTDPLTEMGCIFGTGVNGAYYDRVENITKINGQLEDDIPQKSKMLINCEYGSFDNGHKVLPRTKFDIEIDDESPRPGQQAFEKMTSGYYLGELMRKAMLEGYDEGHLFIDLAKDSEGAKNLHTAYILDTSFLSTLESDETADLSDTEKEFTEKLSIATTLEERYFSKKLASFIGTRAARLSICGISAVCKKMDYKHCHIAADGSVFMKYPYFPERAAQALSDVWGYEGIKMEDHPIQIVRAEDGSGVGAAVIAALSAKRVTKGLSLGLKQ
ncbi:DEKNAAC104449 [Brettanomyces naardenensis]|uniref:Phosphotransferase n=1 Tax=Brettanomyces naardenensis TaxID=13370 RepID=A0A448YR95_BRENA|nr:DEKNAAC104449 [Brettanomyces naardenensis]